MEKKVSPVKLFLVIILAGLTTSGFMNSCTTQTNDDVNGASYALVIHGGAGVRARTEMTPELEKDYRAELEKSLKAGFEILEKGGASVEAVEAAIRVMEDSPLFNAGKGASFTREGKNELDASIMNGKTLRAGGLGAVREVKNPISLARMVMEQTPHVLLVDQGALAFAKEMGVELMPEEYFYTERQWNSLQRRLKEEIPYGAAMPTEQGDSAVSGSSDDAGLFDTVGAVALDKEGNLAAGTSTGGRVKKRPGRVGDSPIIGASTYANNKTCAVSTTGLGEKHMVLLTAKEISALLDHKGMDIEEAVRNVLLEQLVAIGGSGGVISIDKKGKIAWAFTTNGMYRGYMKSDGERVVRIYED